MIIPLEEADRLQLDVHIRRHPESSFSRAGWTASFAGAANGVRLESIATGDTARDAINSAWQKFDRALTHGPRLQLAIEAKTETVLDDEIPF